MRLMSVGPVRWGLLVAAVAWCLSFGGSHPAVGAAPAARGAAPAEGKGITVGGFGQGKGKPVLVEFVASVSGEAELAADAIVKHRDTKRRGLKAIEDLKVAGLTVESLGFAVNQAIDPNMQMMMMRGQTPTVSKQLVQVTEQLKIVLKDADKLKDEDLMNTVLKIVDTARDGGLVVGPGNPNNYYQMQRMVQMGQSTGMGLATFKIPDSSALRAQAYQKAMDDARAKAQRLAELAGAKLGRIESVQEGAMTPQQMQQMVNMYGYIQQSPPDQSLTSSVFGDVTMSVSLSVQFALE